MNIHEELFVKNFIVLRKRGRYFEFLSKKEKRETITSQFDHCGDLEEKYKTQILPNKQNAEDVYKILKGKNAPENCYALSSDEDIDGKEINLKKALKENVFDAPFIYTGTFLSCIPGKLVFYSSEEINGRYILEKQ